LRTHATEWKRLMAKHRRLTRNSKFYRQALREALKKRPVIERVTNLLQKALMAGDPQAAYALGTWYLHGKNVKQDARKAVLLLRQPANANVANALYDLAVCYEKGVGTKKNLARAFQYYLRGALHGDEQSYHEVGRCYYYGIGTAKDRPVAWIWLDRARDFGIPSGDETARDRTTPF